LRTRRISIGCARARSSRRGNRGRERLAAAAADRRLEDAKRELAALQPAPSAPGEPAPRPPGLATHLVVFGVTACATFAGYTLLF
jgi:hypothetical protein